MLTRRAALEGGTATVAAIAVAGAVAARIAVDDPVVALVEEITRVSKAWNIVHDANDKREYKRLEARYWELREEICETPARTIRGVLAKFTTYYCDGEIEEMRRGGEAPDELALDLLGSIFRDLERLAERAEA